MTIFSYSPKAIATRILMLLLDLIIVTIAIFSSNFILSTTDNITLITKILPPILGAHLISFKSFRTYSIIIRYIGNKDITKTFYALLSGFFGGLLIMIIFHLIELNEVTFLFVLYSFSIAAISLPLLRLLMISAHQLIYGDGQKSVINTIIFGAGESGVNTLRLLRNNKSHNYNVVAIFDDNPLVHNKFLDGIPVYNSDKTFDEIIKKHKVKQAIISVQKITSERKKRFIDKCLSHEMTVKQIPPVEFWTSSDLKITHIKDVKLDDLLNRPAITLNYDNISNYINGKRILVTGGAGSIGSEIIRQLVKFNPLSIVVIDNAETPIVNVEIEIKERFKFSNLKIIMADVSDINRMSDIFKDYSPNIVFHAAAYKHVPVIEDYPSEGVRVNILGTKIVADLSIANNVDKFVMISTDKAVNPTNVMGASKRIAEIYIQSLFYKKNKTQFITTRFGNVLGSNGSVVPRFKKQIEEGGPITVTHPEITRYFMTIPEACQLVLEAGSIGQGGEIFIFDMGNPVRILDLAINMIKLSGLKPYEDIEIVFTGLRPGEKLTEELLNERETVLPTHHEKIKKAQVQLYTYSKVNAEIVRLIESVNKVDELKIVKHMKSILPEFISNNSIYCSLDIKHEVSKN